MHLGTMTKTDGEVGQYGDNENKKALHSTLKHFEETLQGVMKLHGSVFSRIFRPAFGFQQAMVKLQVCCFTNVPGAPVGCTLHCGNNVMGLLTPSSHTASAIAKTNPV